VTNLLRREIVHVIMNGEKVRGLREEQGLSKKALANKAGVTQATIARAEDSRPMFPQTARLLGAALGVDARSLAKLRRI
jgi:transcriptional regulator with XRE-family HTH domain